MADETNAGGGAGAGAAGAGASGGAGGGDFAGMSDADVLDRAAADQGGAGGGQGGAADQGAAAAAGGKETPSGDKTTAGEGTPEEVNLAALEEGQPEWLTKVTDEAARGEVTKLLELNKAFGTRFKDVADLEAFFKDIPGGREEIAAMQTLSREVGELDSFIEGNDFNGHVQVADRVLSQAPENAVSMTRAWAKTVAEKQPEAWQQISGELVDSTLKAAGIGVNFGELRQTLGEIREALKTDNAENFGKAVGKLLGEPKAERQEDPNVVRAREAERRAQTAERTAKVKDWDAQVNKNGDAIEQHVRTEIGKALSIKDSQGRPLIPASVPAAKRDELVNSIMKEIDTQVAADRWLASQITSLVGMRNGDKQNLGAGEKEFGEALRLSKDAVGRVMSAAVKKVVSSWARELVASNTEARNRAKGGAGAQRTDAGAGAGAGRGGRGAISMDDLVGPKALTDAQLLDRATGLN